MTIPSASAQLSSLVERAYARGRFPGLVAGTFGRGVVDWQCALGETAAAYRIASITKTFTAVAVLQLRDEGLLDLDDALGRHLRDTPFADHTVRRLLSHASGITAEPAGPWWERIPGGDWAQLVAANRDSEQVFAPGERHHYSNLGYALLGELVSRLRERPWWAVVKERIVEPAGLTRTTLAKPRDAAVGTSVDPLTDTFVREPAEDQGAMAPAGQLWSTLEDLGRWADVLATGHPDVLSRSTATQMRTVQSGDPDSQHRGGYGLGLRLHWSTTGTLIGHTGSLPGFLAGMFTDPVRRTGAVVLTNSTTGLEPEELCAALIEPAISGTKLQPLTADPSSPAADLTGRWYWGNTVLTVVPDADGFILCDGPSRSTFRRSGGVYRADNGYLAGERLAIHRDDAGRPFYLQAATFVFTRTPYDPAAPIPGSPPQPL